MEMYGSDKVHFLKEIMDLMEPLEGGSIELRDFLNTDKWLSTDYTLSNPGSSKAAFVRFVGLIHMYKIRVL
ncbi:hypothetical protein OM416_02450 [Paenibacillus sp. LS1]|uniref:hypothetical protein n=1 Tax=Paenibacillus sp. LS1 TaxID=2992120 RepID=UPI002230D376|nr:hypothetical protein [Paenibacillus sp. LS1]MCW3790420.1 hypothetical protein [Paenibacillus sp. LS1]